MSLPHRHDPPAHLDDLLQIPQGHAQWHAYIDRLLDDAVAGIQGLNLPAPGGGVLAPQFFNPSRRQPVGQVIELPILWNAFPRRLLLRHGRDLALTIADLPWPDGAPDDFNPLSPRWGQAAQAASRWHRPQDEYCEWRVERDAATQRIRRLVFTVEAPEYWAALHGGPGQPVPGGPTLVTRLYRRLLRRPLAAADLLTAQDHRYDPLNRWNTSHGIVHLSHPDNVLRAQVELCADATLSVRGPHHGLVTDALALCVARNEAKPNRHSDPAIMGSINALARRGAALSLANPVGLCIDHVDTSGWSLPGLADPRSLLHIERGTPGRILRLVVQAPAQCPHGLDRLNIAGEPLLYGGQIAECITVKAVALAVLPPTPLPLTTVDASHAAWLSAANAGLLLARKHGVSPLPGEMPAFVRELHP